MRLRRSRAAAAAVGVVALVMLTAAPGVAEDDPPTPEEFVIADPRITESSGLQASHAHPGIYWTHNDSDYAPEIYAVDSATGETVAAITLEGVEFRDVEAIHLGPDGDLYVGDIGDNLGGGWDHVWIYRFSEPDELVDAALTPTVYTVQYDDGPRDAEALMVDPTTGRVYLASKERRGEGAVYAGPQELSPDGINVFERQYDIDLQVTDGAFAPDGSRLLLRGYFDATMFDWEDGAPEPIGSVTVPFQPQGESVTFTPDGRTLMFGTEGERSRVSPVELSDSELPLNAQEMVEPDASEESGGDGSGSGDSADGEEDTSLEVRTVVFVVVATLLVVALRRVFRGTGRRRG